MAWVIIFNILYRDQPVTFEFPGVQLPYGLCRPHKEFESGQDGGGDQFVGVIQFAGAEGAVKQFEARIFELVSGDRDLTKALRLKPPHDSNRLKSRYFSIGKYDYRDSESEFTGIKISGRIKRCSFFEGSGIREHAVSVNSDRHGPESVRHSFPSKSTGSFVILPKGWISSAGFGVKFCVIQAVGEPRFPHRPLLLTTGRGFIREPDARPPVIQDPALNLDYDMVTKRLGRHLDQFNSDHAEGRAQITIEQLQSILEVTGGCLTGSCMIQAVLGCYYGGSDIDVFIGDTVDPRNLCYRFWGLRPREATPSQYKSRRFMGQSRNFPVTLISDVITYDNGIQFIQIDCSGVESLVSYIHQFFDLTACTTILTQDRFIEPVGGLQMLLEGKMRVNRNYGFINWRKRAARITKYTSRRLQLVAGDRDGLECRNPDCIEQSATQFFRSRCGHSFHLACNRDRYSFDQCPDCLHPLKGQVCRLLIEHIQFGDGLLGEYSLATKPLETASEVWSTQHREFAINEFVSTSLAVKSVYALSGQQIFDVLSRQYQEGVFREMARIEQEYKRQIMQLEAAKYEQLGRFGSEFTCVICTEPLQVPGLARLAANDYVDPVRIVYIIINAHIVGLPSEQGNLFALKNKGMV